MLNVRDATGVTFEALKRELYSEQSKPKESEDNVVNVDFNDNYGGKTVMASRYVLSSYLFNKPFALETDINGLNFELPEHKEIQRYISQKLSEGQKPKFNELYDFMEDGQEELSRIAGMETDQNKRYDQAVYFNDCLRTIKQGVINREIEVLNKMFIEETDTEKRREIAKKLSVLLVEKKRI